MTPRLYLDEDLSTKLAQLLRSRGYDVVSAHEVGAERIPDPDQLSRAVADGRAILTSNYTHFMELAEQCMATGRHHFGIIVSFRQCPDNALGQFADAVQRLIEAYTAELLENALVPLDAFR